MKASWEKRLYKVGLWCACIAVAILLVRLLVFKSRPSFTPGPDAIWLFPGALFCLAGTALGLLLLWPFYQKFFFGNWLGRVLVGLLSAVAFTVAKILADLTVLEITWLPAEWFPRSQEVLTGLFSLIIFVLLSYLIVIILMLIFLMFDIIGQIGSIISMIKIFLNISQRLEWYNKLAHSSIFVMEVGLAIFATAVFVGLVLSGLGYYPG